MASINRSRNAEFGRVADDDPFAELTRIVGQNPLASDRSLAANDPLGLDMENELMGNLARFERPAPAVPAHEPADDVEPASDADDFDLAMDAEFEAAFEDEWDVEDMASAADGTPEMRPAPEPEARDVPTAPAWDVGLEAPLSTQAADVENKPHLFDRIQAELRANDSLRTNVVEADQARTLSDEEITAVAAEWEEQNGVTEPDDAGAAPQDASPEALFASGEAASAQEPLSFMQDAELDAPSAEEAGTPAFSMDMPDLLLDSDLETAFADGEGESEAGSLAEDDVPFDYDRAAADRHVYLEQVLDDSLPDTFGEADVAPPSEADASAQAEETAAYIPLSKSDEAAQPAPSTGSIMRDAVISTFATVPLWGKTRRERPAPRRDGHEDAVVPAVLPAESAMRAEEPERLEDEPAPFEDAGRPQVDTIDIEDRAAAVVDDLDIPEPELPPEPIADSEFHELAAELAGAFGEMTDEALAEPETAVSEPRQTATAFAGQQYLFEQQDADHVSAFPAQEQYQFETTAAASGFDAPFEPTGREDFNAWAGDMDDEEAAAAPARRRAPLFARFGRRGVIGAAALAGLVVIGGASVYALSAGGGGLGQPVLIKASDEPFKVKPKDPGGRTVSADNAEVYQRASGNVGDVPEQKALLTTTEEPLDLSKTVAPRIVDASAVIGAPSDAAAAADDDWSKSQARLAPTDEAQGSDVPPALTVQARRVETFIVKPDGTLVPREPAKEEAARVASAAPTALGASDGAVMDDSSPAVEASDETEARATVDAASESEAETAAPAENTEPAAVASNAPAAEKPALAPAATKAASDWSVQISSQPTPEAAQESYRSMAERYGDLLAGRGVNIVKADISGKGIYYRVRIPSASKDEAIDLCTKLKDAGGNCFVSK